MSQFMSELELEVFCPRCKQEHKASFESEFFGSWHYIKGYCANCNYRLMKRCDFLGMGFIHLSKEEFVEKIKECFQK